MKVVFLLCATTMFAGCGGASASGSPPRVASEAASPHFDAVAQHLRLGGTAYAYIDVDGDLLELVRAVSPLLGSLPEEAGVRDFNLEAFMDAIGLTGIRAAGLSSERSGESYINRLYYYAPPPHRGLLAMLDRAPHAFSSLDEAPSNTDLLIERDLDVRTGLLGVLEALRAAKPSLHAEATALLNETIPAMATQMTWQNVLDQLDTRVVIIARVRQDRMTIPDSTHSMPLIDFAMSLDDLGPLFDALMEVPATEAVFGRTVVGEHTVFEAREPLPFGDYRIALARHGASGRVFLASTRGFLESLLRPRGDSLRTSDAFRETMRGLPERGNGITYVSAHLVSALRTELSQLRAPEEVRPFIQLMQIFLPSGREGIGGVQSNDGDGLLEVSRGPLSHKTTLFTLSPVWLGIAAGVAVPAFVSYRQTIARTRTEEARASVRSCAYAVVSYAEQQNKLPRAASWTPAEDPSAAGYPDNPQVWSVPPWNEIGFSQYGYHRYRYRLQVTRREFTCEAEGDLDDDGVRSRFMIHGEMKPDGEVALDDLVAVDEDE